MKLFRNSLFVSIAGIVVAFIIYLFLSNDLDILQPSGIIAQQQSNLLVFAFMLSMIVILPVFGLAIYIGIKYRDGNKNSTYSPNISGNKKLETIWWGLPILIILVLSIVTFKTSHSLEPSKALASDKKPLEIQVVALQWNWLFIYPEQGIATTNYVEIPVNRPISFAITSDAPMNSFWIPKLGGQIYAMSGMVTRLNLEANEAGEFRGSSANISGEGFSEMDFRVKAVDGNSFNSWVSQAKTIGGELNRNTYSNISFPGAEVDEITYSKLDDPIFDDIRHKYDYGHDHGITYKQPEDGEKNEGLN